MGSGNSVERQAFVAESENSLPDIRDAAAKLMAEVRREDRPPPAWEEVPRARESFATFGSSHGRGSFDDVARFDHTAAGRESFEDATGRCSFYDVQHLAAAATPAWHGDARPERSGAATAAGEAPSHDDITGETWHRVETSASHDDITGETWHRGETSAHFRPAPGDGLRVSIVFRSVDKSFLRKAPPRVATYASGAARVVAAEAVVGDARRHLSELISAREAAKAPAETRPADLAQFYRGRGPMAALLAV
jgi:hypothetical protein